MSKAMVATEDQYVLICAILRRRKLVKEMSERLLKKDLNEPAAIVNAYQTVKLLLTEWSKAKVAQMPMFYDINQYNAMSMLAQWVVEKFHSINGTPVPPQIKIWSICFQDAGASSLKEAGLTLG